MNEIKTIDEFVALSKKKAANTPYRVGEDLGLAIINHINANIFLGESVIIAIGLFNDNQSLTEKYDTVPFFQKNRYPIQMWLRRCAPNESPNEISDRLSLLLTKMTSKDISSDDVQAVVFKGDTACESYQDIADGLTKTLATSVALWFVKDHRPAPPTFIKEPNYYSA